MTERVRPNAESEREAKILPGTRKISQQARWIDSLGVTPESSVMITRALGFFDGTEFRKTIPARDALIGRLADLANGKTVPVVVFNCLDFDWKAASGTYPQARILADTSTSICEYFQEDLKTCADELNKLSHAGAGVDVCIIVPDSELFDERVFPFAQYIDDRLEIATKVKSELSKRFERFQTSGQNPVMFWSEYCKTYGLASPRDYTAANASKLLDAATRSGGSEAERNLFSSVLKQKADSKKYFTNKGLGLGYIEYDIPDRDMLERVIWYCAMYMGEGQALAESNAIVVNFEDFRVAKWYNIGSSNKLPIITPVNPNTYYNWRKQKKSELSRE